MDSVGSEIEKEGGWLEELEEEEEEEGGEKEAMEARNDRDGQKVEEDKDLRADVGGVEGRRRNDDRQDQRACEARRPAGCCTG